MSDSISRHAVLEFIVHLDVDFANSFDPHTLTEIYRYVKEMPSVENNGEPTDEEVIRYCNKRGYVIFTQDIIDYLKREQRGIRFEGYVRVNGAEFARLLECKGGE